MRDVLNVSTSPSPFSPDFVMIPSNVIAGQTITSHPHICLENSPKWERVWIQFHFMQKKAAIWHGFCSGNFTSPTAWMIDLLNFALGFCPLVRSRVSSPSTLGQQLLLASIVCKVASLQRHDLANIGFYKHELYQEFYNRRLHSFIIWHDFYRQIEECRV